MRIKNLVLPVIHHEPNLIMTTSAAPQPAEVPYSIPLKTAEQWVSNWIDADPKTPVRPDDMRAFLIRKQEFLDILTQFDTEYIRLYVGRKPLLTAETGSGSGTDPLQPCLVLVSAARRGDVGPVAGGKNPDDVIDLIGVMNPTRPLEAVNYQVFDFTKACPPDCDTDSPLFIGEADERCLPNIH